MAIAARVAKASATGGVLLTPQIIRSPRSHPVYHRSTDDQPPPPHATRAPTGYHPSTPPHVRAAMYYPDTGCVTIRSRVRKEMLTGHRHTSRSLSRSWIGHARTHMQRGRGSTTVARRPRNEIAHARTRIPAHIHPPHIHRSHRSTTSTHRVILLGKPGRRSEAGRL